MFTRRRTAQRAAALLVLLAALAAPTALAQGLSFVLEENRVSLYIEQDGRVQIVYDMTFAVDPGSAPIDYVDVGMPNTNWSLSDVRASAGGVELTDLSSSPYVDNGVAVGLGSQTIQPGQTGTLHIEATVRGMLYQDKDPEYASLEFIPHYYGSDIVHGSTRLEVNFHLPLGVTADEPRYHDQPFTEAGFEDDRVVYTWIDEAASGSKKYAFGASFPKKYLDEGVVQKPPAFTVNLRSLFSSPIWCIVLFIGAWVGIAALGSRTQKRRKMAYLPPSLAVEGAGVKRGLTAVEAAILLEAPLNKVLTMILFGLVKKGLVTVESEKPLKLTRVAPPQNVSLWPYEKRFLEALRDDGSVAEGELREMMIDLIGDVNKKVAAFNRKETKAYYQDIAARAWKQVEAADTPEVLGERWSDGLEWTMLEDDWDDRTRRVFRDRPVVVPNWWSGYRPWSAPTAAHPATSLPAPAGGGTPVTLPTLPGADFANTVVRGVENAANTVVGSVERFTGGIVDKTNPLPKPAASTSSRSRSSGGGGHSCACACACACAGCACACAGGGR